MLHKDSKNIMISGEDSFISSYPLGILGVLTFFMQLMRYSDLLSID